METIRVESFKHLIQIIKLIEQEPEEKRREHFANLGRSCLFFLVYDILGYRDINLQLAWAMCEFWEKPDRNKLGLLPRGTFKTSIFSIGGSIFEILRNKDIRILLTNANLDNAKAILKGIQDHFIHNQKFRYLYPELCPSIEHKSKIREFGIQDQMRVPNQRHGIREATIEIGAVEQNLVSRHYEVHIGDDLVNQMNTSTREQINKVDNFIKAAYALLEPGVGRCYLVGTRWSFDDPYGRIIEDKETAYAVYIRKILEPDENGRLVSIFPERFPKDEIRRIKKNMGNYLFYSQMMNDPVSEEDQVFKPSWFKYYSDLPEPMIKGMDRVAFVDPAVSEAKGADYTAFVVLGATPGGIYVLDAFRRRMNPGELIEMMFTLQSKWKVRKFGVETISFQKALAFFLNRTMMVRKEFIPIEEVGRDGNVTKEMRIRGLQPIVQHCNFYIKREMEDLKDEMIRFPRNSHDDLVDALSGAQLLLKPIYHYGSGEDNVIGLTFGKVLRGIQERNKAGEKIGAHRLVRRHGFGIR